MAADGSVVIEITGEDREFRSSLTSLGDVANSALKGVTAAVAGASAAIVGLAAGAAKVGSEFESTMAATSTMFGDVAVDTQGLTSKILELSNASGVAASEINSSLYDALSSGIPVTEDMGEAMEFMDSSVKLAAAGFTDINTATMATAKVMNAYGMAVTDVDKIHKVLIQTQNYGITTVDELGATLAQVTPTAAAMGVSFEQVGAALSVMTAQGTPTAQATTQLNSLIAELGKNGTQAAKNLAEATAGTQYAGQSFTQLMNSGVPLNEVLNLMGAYAEKNGKSLIDMFSSIEAGKSALSLAGQNSQSFADALAAMSTETDVVGVAYDKVTDTLQHKIATLKESVKNLGIAVYTDTEGMAAPLKEAATQATEWVGQIQEAFTQGGLQGAVSTMGTVLSEAITAIANEAPKMVEAGVMLLQSLAKGMIENGGQIGASLVGVGAALVNGIISVTPTILAAAGQLVLSIGSSIMGQAPSLMQSAAEMLKSLSSGLRENLPTLISEGLTMLTSFSGSLRENVGLLVDAGLSLVMALADGIIQSLPALISNIPQIITNIAGCINDNAPKLIATAAVLLGKLAIGLIQAIPALIRSIPKIIEAIIAVWMAFNWISLGKQAITAIKDGILAMVGKVSAAGKTVLDNIYSALASLPSKLLELGRSGVTGIINGLRSMLSSLGGAARSLLDTVITGIASLPAKVLEIGKQVIQGLINGLTSGVKAVGQAVGNIAGGMLDKFKSVLGIHSPSREFALLGEFSMEGYAIGLKNAEGKVIKTVAELSESILEAATGWVDEKRYYNSLAARDELIFWQSLRSMAGLQAKELAKIDKSIYAAKVNASKESFEASKAWIEREKFYNRLSATEEIAAWERVVQRKNLLTEQQLEAEKNLYTAQQQVQEQQRESAKEYEDNLRSRTESLRSFAGLFDEMKTNSEVTGQELLKNLRGQVDLFEGWQKNMETLTSRGVTGPLLDELRELGPRAAAEIKALTTLSDSELQEYVKLFAEKGKLASDEAEKELSGTAIELPVSVAVLSNEQAMAAVGNSVAAIGTAVAANTEKLKDTASTIARVMCETILSKHSDFYGVGVDAMRGLDQGLADQGRAAIATARRIADSIIWEMQRALDIHSPSRKMRDLVGIPTAQGFMVGFEEEMAGLSKRMQNAIDAETSNLSVQAATQAEYKAANSGVTREVYRHSNTVEKLARVEGDGVTGELVRMLGLRIKTEDNRVGDSLVN